MDEWSKRDGLSSLQQRTGRLKECVARSTREQACPPFNPRDAGILRCTQFLPTKVRSIPDIGQIAIVCGEFCIPSDELCSFMAIPRMGTYYIPPPPPVVVERKVLTALEEVADDTGTVTDNPLPRDQANGGFAQPVDLL